MPDTSFTVETLQEKSFPVSHTSCFISISVHGLQPSSIGPLRKLVLIVTTYESFMLFLKLYGRARLQHALMTFLLATLWFASSMLKPADISQAWAWLLLVVVMASRIAQNHIRFWQYCIPVCCDYIQLFSLLCLVVVYWRFDDDQWLLSGVFSTSRGLWTWFTCLPDSGYVNLTMSQAVVPIFQTCDHELCKLCSLVSP